MNGAVPAIDFCAALLLLLLLFLHATVPGEAVHQLCSHCPSNRCAIIRHSNCSCLENVRSKMKIGDSGYSDGEVSIGFVVDSTGSMSGVIESVKTRIRSVLNSSSGVFNKVVVSEFNDPYRRSLVDSSNSDDVINFVNELTADGGDDCPEYALSAIRDVAQLVTSGSVIFVFTDASPKDFALKGQVLELLKSKSIRLHLIASGNLCNNDRTLIEISAKTGGSIYLGKGSDDSLADDVLDYTARFAKLGASFMRGLPKNMTELKSIVQQSCRCEPYFIGGNCTKLPVSADAAHVDGRFDRVTYSNGNSKRSNKFLVNVCNILLMFLLVVQ